MATGYEPATAVVPVVPEGEVRLALVRPPPGDAEPYFEDSPYQSVSTEPNGYRLVLRGRRPPADFVPPALPLEIEDEKLAVFLEPTPQAQSDAEEIAAVARQITEDAPNALVAAARVVNWVWTNIAKRGGARGNATALEVLRSREGDCSEHAHLTVALCRAAGIPARAVGGLEYLVSSRGEALAGFHAWAEVWTGRWVPVDATIPEVGTSARYIFTGIDEPGHSARIESMIAGLAGGLKLQILAWKHYGKERVEAPEAAAPAR